MTDEHISEELPRLLTGDAPHDVVLAAAEHLRRCPDCQQELVSAVVAHASLTSAQRFAPEVVARRSDGFPTLLPPPAHADDSGTVDESTGGATDERADEPVTAEPELPDLSGVFQQVRDEAARGSQSARPLRTRRTLLTAAAAVVILAGGGVAIGYAVDGGQQPAGRTVSLAAFDVGRDRASAVVDGDTVRIDATSLPALTSGARYEVWLTNAGRSRMAPIGFIADDRTADLTVSRSVMNRYTDIEVSVQRGDQQKYSGVSVLRGAY